jgi:hypothetical protein
MVTPPTRRDFASTHFLIGELAFVLFLFFFFLLRRKEFLAQSSSSPLDYNGPINYLARAPLSQKLNKN